MLKTGMKAGSVAPELRITIMLSDAGNGVKAEGIIKERKPWHGWKKMKNRQLVKEAKDRVLESEGKITGRKEFEREYAQLYHELCRRNLQGKIGLPRKKRKNKYGSKTTEELVEKALAKIAIGGIPDTRQFCRVHRWLYNALNQRECVMLCEKKSKTHNHILAYGIKYAKEHGIKDGWQLGAEYSILYNVLHDWKLLPLMKYGQPAAA